MSIDVYIPTPFRRATNNKDRVSVAARDVRGLLDELEGSYSGLKGLVRNEAGEIHHHVNIYVNNEGIESLQGLKTPLKDGDEVSIIPALAGGQASPRPGGGPALAGGDRRPPGADRLAATMILTPEEYAKIQDQAVAEYPSECCGVVMERPGAQPERLLLACRNIQNELHAKDPKRHPRDARTAYYIDPRDLIVMGRHEAQSFRVLTIYHSHIDAGAYFSPTDRANALVNGEPAYPDATYVVLSVLERRLDDVGVFRWDPAIHDFGAVEWKKPNG